MSSGDDGAAATIDGHFCSKNVCEACGITKLIGEEKIPRISVSCVGLHQVEFYTEIRHLHVSLSLNITSLQNIPLALSVRSQTCGPAEVMKARALELFTPSDLITYFSLTNLHSSHFIRCYRCYIVIG